jgi:hypothetical protein
MLELLIVVYSDLSSCARQPRLDNNEITTGKCVNAPLSNGIILGGAPSGGATTSGAPDQLACNFERGRQIWLRLSLRPLALGK